MSHMEIHKSKPVLWLCFYRHILVFRLSHKKILIFHFKHLSFQVQMRDTLYHQWIAINIGTSCACYFEISVFAAIFFNPIIDIPSSIPNSKANLKSLMLRKKYSPHIEKENVRTSGQFTSILFQFLQDFFASKSHSI